VALTIELSAPELLQELVDTLVRLHCIVYASSENACRVVFTEVRDPSEALVELSFFLSAWGAQHPGVEASIRL
jgi:hypothetical protein